MIGKKSKFLEHEQVQDNKKGSKSKGDSNPKGEPKKRISSKETLDDNVYPREEYSNYDTEHRVHILMETENNEEQIEEVPEEIQQTKGFIKDLRSSGKDKIQDGRSHEDSSRKEDKDSSSKKASTTITTIVCSKTTKTKTDTEILWDEICNGIKGKNSGIPMGFNRLNRYLGLRKSIYTTIGASAGCGKTSLVDCAYVLNPYDWYIKNKSKSTVKFEVIYFSMERKKTYKLAKWLCMKMWKEEKVLLTTDELLSWQTKLDSRKQEMAKFYIDNYFKEMTESGIVTILDGQQNPTGIYKYLYAHALKRGKEEQVNQWENRYIANDDNLITNVIHDHAGKTKNENIGGKYDKKLSIDKASEYYCWARDYLGYSPIMINQFNRTSYQDIQFSRKENSDPDPTVEYWKDSGNVIEDCDVAISLFNPYKYNIEDYMGYKINDFTDNNGNNKFRGLKIIKNSYGTDNVRIGLGFLGEVSLFKELTKSRDISQKELNSIINNDFFLDF